MLRTSRSYIELEVGVIILVADMYRYFGYFTILEAELRTQETSTRSTVGRDIEGTYCNRNTGYAAHTACSKRAAVIVQNRYVAVGFSSVAG